MGVVRGFVIFTFSEDFRDGGEGVFIDRSCEFERIRVF